MCVTIQAKTLGKNQIKSNMPTFLLEVGTEELPASFVQQAIGQWQNLIPATLKEHFLNHTTINVYGTPRRLAVLIEGLPLQQADRDEEVKGPPATTAFKDGKPTPAAIGFAKKQNVPVESLELRATDKGEFVFIKKQIPGQKTADILTELVPYWLTKLEGKRLMRWSDGDLRFPRPIRWLVTLLDEVVLKVNLVNGSESIKSDRVSFAHRVLHPQPVSIKEANHYVETMRSAFVEVDPMVRQTKIKAEVTAAAKKINGSAEIPEDLLAEVINLVEWPIAVTGKFDEEFLILPPEVIKTVMVTHQRYFPVLKQEKSADLLPYFITISNGDPAKAAVIASGNERVIRARLADGQFFYKADTAKPLSEYVEKLKTVTFQESLGTIKDKVDRILGAVDILAKQLNIEDVSLINRTALLCKADLVTQMVYEFPELQGVMGEKYARVSEQLKGEDLELVAQGIFEHYLPRGAGDILPETLTGQIVGIADRLDTLVGIFGLGMLPTGSSDPFALRRAANAIVNIIWHGNLGINLEAILHTLVDQFHQYKATASPELFNQLSEFFLQRMRTLLIEEKGIDYDLVNAVLGENDREYSERALQDLLDLRDRALFLQTIRANGALAKIYETVNRSTRLAAQGDLDKHQLSPQNLVEPGLFQKKSEQEFYEAIVELVPKTEAAKKSRNYQDLVQAIEAINPRVTNFFDGGDSVLVMDPDLAIRQNRLNLLGLLRNHARVLADFGCIVKS